MKSVVLLILLNLNDGSQHVVSQSVEMDAAVCAPLAQAVWAMPIAANPDVMMTADGMLSKWDAACVPVDQL